MTSLVQARLQGVSASGLSFLAAVGGLEASAERGRVIIVRKVSPRGSLASPRNCGYHYPEEVFAFVRDILVVERNYSEVGMARAIQAASTWETRRVEAFTVIALASLTCILGYVVSPPLMGLEMSYAGGAAVVVGIGAVVCAGLRSRAARIATASVVLGLVSIRIMSAVLPQVFVRPHGVPSLLDSVAMLILMATAGAMVVVASIRR